jgi:hypothetical protein
MKKHWQAILGLMLVILVTAPAMVSAKQVDCTEALAAAETFKNQVIQRDGGWGQFPLASIEGCQEFTRDGKLLGFFLPVSPKGYIMVNPLTQLEPVKGYSTESDLDTSATGGVTKLLRDTMGATRDTLENGYGSLKDLPEYGQIAPQGNQDHWDRLLGRDSTSGGEAGVDSVPVTSLTVGPLLTSIWHQDAPYNNSCPMGDGGTSLVGCVATAAAQIMKFWNYPASGIGSKTYYWYGDTSCGGSTAGSNLSATFSDSYDWANMLDDATTGSSSAQQAAVAELSYEVGVAFEMDYGYCGSAAYTADAVTVFPYYFNYAGTTAQKYRSSYSATTWFNEIRKEFDAAIPRPIQYRINTHSIVCDGYRNPNYIHLNYGWHGSQNLWYVVDNLYCPWSGCNSNVEYIVAGIQPKNRLTVSHIGSGGQIYYGTWGRALTSFSAGAIGGGGTSSHAPTVALYQNKLYMAVKGAASNRIYIKSRTGRLGWEGTSWTLLTGLTSTSPALISYNNRLYLFVKGSSDALIYYCYMDSLGTWSSWSVVSGSSTLHKPALVVFNDRLYLFLTGGTNRILYDSMDYAGTWSGWSILPTGLSDRAPAVVNYSGGILLFVKGMDNHPWYTVTSTPENSSSWVTWTQLDGLTSATPSVAVVPETNRLHLAVAGVGSSGIYQRYWGGAWSAWQSVMGLSPNAYTEDTPALHAFYMYDEATP